jgi:tetratricopeptide (TPR) repeat protein
MGQFERAELDLKESLRIHLFCADNTDDNAEVAAALHNLGIVRFLMMKYEEAMDALARAYKGRRNLFGYDHMDVSRSIDALGSVHLMLGDEVNAMKCHREALRVKQLLLGNCHPSLVATIMNIAKVYRVQGELAMAVHVYEEAFEMQKAIYPDWDKLEDVGVTVHTVGFTYVLKRDYRKAMEAFDQTSKIYAAAGLSSKDKRVVALNKSKSEVGRIVSGIRRKYSIMK